MFDILKVPYSSDLLINMQKGADVVFELAKVYVIIGEICHTTFIYLLLFPNLTQE